MVSCHVMPIGVYLIDPVRKKGPGMYARARTSVWVWVWVLSAHQHIHHISSFWFICRMLFFSLADAGYDVQYLYFCNNYVYWPKKTTMFSYLGVENLTNTVDIYYQASGMCV